MFGGIDDVPAYDLSWNLPAIHWMENFSKRRRAAHKRMEKRSFVTSEMADVLVVVGADGSALGWLLRIRGVKETYIAIDHAKSAIYLS
jgi:hypothetical protein